MRKRFRVLLLAAIVGAFAVPVGFALSLEQSSVSTHHRATAPEGAIAANVLVASGNTALPGLIATDAHPVPDAAKLLFVGSLLFGLAAAVRKAI